MLRSCVQIASYMVAFALLPASPPQTLRQAANVSRVLIGTAARPTLLSEAAYSATLAREFNMVEAEDAMKWWVVRATAEGYDFEPGDEIVR